MEMVCKSHVHCSRTAVLSHHKSSLLHYSGDSSQVRRHLKVIKLGVILKLSS